MQLHQWEFFFFLCFNGKKKAFAKNFVVSHKTKKKTVLLSDFYVENKNVMLSVRKFSKILQLTNYKFRNIHLSQIDLKTNNILIIKKKKKKFSLVPK